MSYQALYRVWRPRQFKDLVGQSHITQTLQNALVERQFSHAYLFSGPRGTGKTSAAKIFAQTINCEQMPTREPCNECAACRGILDGSISDVIEMDAASNTSVEDIRDIRDRVTYASSSVPYKVYIIDEVHMISANAFNALLKTLEEPPEHVVFILATTEPHKIPLTVVSRCQRFDFKSMSNKVIVDRLRYVMSEEQEAISDEALEAVALHAEGGMRDALSILDQAISFANERVEVADVLAVTGGVSQDVLTEMAEAMYHQDTKRTLHTFDDMIQNGKDAGRFVFDFIYFLRDMLFYKATPDLEGYLERAIVTGAFKKLVSTVEEDWIHQAMMEFTACEQQIKWTNSPRVFVEVALLAVAHNEKVISQAEEQAHVPVEEPFEAGVSDEQITTLMNRIDALEKKLHTLSSQEHDDKKASLSMKQRPQKPRKERTSQVSKQKIFDVLHHAEKKALQNMKDAWDDFLGQLKRTNAAAHATIQNSQPVAASADAVIVAFKYEIHCSLFTEHQGTAESILQKIFDKNINIRPIPEPDWFELRQEFIQNEQHSDAKETPREEKNELVEEVAQIFGEDTLEVHD